MIFDLNTNIRRTHDKVRWDLVRICMECIWRARTNETDPSQNTCVLRKNVRKCAVRVHVCACVFIRVRMCARVRMCICFAAVAAMFMPIR